MLGFRAALILLIWTCLHLGNAHTSTAWTNVPWKRSSVATSFGHLQFERKVASLVRRGSPSKRGRGSGASSGRTTVRGGSSQGREPADGGPGGQRFLLPPGRRSPPSRSSSGQAGPATQRQRTDGQADLVQQPIRPVALRLSRPHPNVLQQLQRNTYTEVPPSANINPHQGPMPSSRGTRPQRPARNAVRPQQRGQASRHAGAAAPATTRVEVRRGVFQSQHNTPAGYGHGVPLAGASRPQQGPHGQQSAHQVGSYAMQVAREHHPHVAWGLRFGVPIPSTTQRSGVRQMRPALPPTQGTGRPHPQNNHRVPAEQPQVPGGLGAPFNQPQYLGLASAMLRQHQATSAQGQVAMRQIDWRAGARVQPPRQAVQGQMREQTQRQHTQAQRPTEASNLPGTRPQPLSFSSEIFSPHNDPRRVITNTLQGSVTERLNQSPPETRRPSISGSPDTWAERVAAAGRLPAQIRVVGHPYRPPGQDRPPEGDKPA